jgi:lactoylglutathione lyase
MSHQPGAGPGRIGPAGADGAERAELVADVTELRVALTVADFDRAVAFYRDALGLDQVADWSSAAGRVIVLAAGQATLELVDEPQAAMIDSVEAGRRVSGTVRLALRVADSDDAARRLVAAGAEPVAPPVTTPWGDRNARVQAPDGMQLTLFTPEQAHGV